VAETGVGYTEMEAAIRALQLPGAAPYRGPIDPGRLGQLLAERRFDSAGLAWLASLRPPADRGLPVPP
jgi:hypothetical protein